VLTRWGRALDRERPLPEYPRPQLVRGTWANLNGIWEHAFTESPDRPTSYDGPIVVPFSPEAELSGVRRQLQPHEWLWYHRTFAAPDPPPGGRVLLHFGAVDQSCTVWVNGHEVGSHTGGYLPFTLDVTEAVSGDDLLEVRVRDLSETSHHARGKQRLDRGQIWYTAQSGIWQTVWLETVPASYVERLVLTPHLDRGELEVTVVAGGDPITTPARVVVSTGSTDVADVEVPTGIPVRIPLAEVHAWSPAGPHLYDVEVTLGEDRVTSYAALRSFGLEPDSDGHPRLLLNGEPFMHAGVLDQGYWPDGLLTPPADEAMVHDIEAMKSLGFTVLRKHAKVEPLRWYAHCDRIGMLVWQDVVNGGGRYRALTTTRPARRRTWIPDRLHGLYGRDDADGRAEFGRELRETVELLHNVASLAVWTPFNEGWGQFDANRVARWLAETDPTRQVNAASGWVDQGGGDLRSFHAYLRPFEMPAPRSRFRPWRHERRAVALSEYGGFSMRVEDHDWSPREFGYRHFDDADSLGRGFVELHEPLADAVRRGLAATVYTQLSDVEDELNGLFTWDREILKIDPAVVRAVTATLHP
jgi:beta-galactosidase/beta-glucuronidase